MLASELARPSIETTQKWVLLRCASSETLRLAQELNKLGIKAWSPVGYKRGRRPRSRSYYDKTYPLTSSYVFACADEVLELEKLVAFSIKGVPVFSVFYYCGEVPKIADAQLEPLREEEQRLRAVYLRQLAKSRRKEKFKVDHEVNFNEGAFAGLRGKIVEHKGAFALVSISGFELPIRVAEALIEDC